MDYDKLLTRYKQFGGFRLVIEYAKLGVLWPAIKAGIWCVVKRQSFKHIYPEVLRKIEPYLVRRYSPIVQEYKQSKVQNQEFEKSRIDSANTYCTNDTNKIIWFCWLQGIENALGIVNACYNSIKRNIPDREMKVIHNENWKEYVELPEYIVKKWENGRIPAALFSDLLRLELLIKYGGTWIDSTVLCTGGKDSNVQELKVFLDADLFLFQYSKPGSIPISISNWFITSCSNNEVLMVLREMLYAYWKDYNCTLDYYIFHLFFAMISKEYPEEINKMPYGSSQNSLTLLHHWGEVFDQKKWNRLTDNVCFHKLAFRVRNEVKNDINNYYNFILNIEKY